MKTTSLLTWLCVLGSSIGLSATLPLEAQYAVSAVLGRDQTAYHVLPNRSAEGGSASGGEPLNREPLNLKKA